MNESAQINDQAKLKIYGPQFWSGTHFILLNTPLKLSWGHFLQFIYSSVTGGYWCGTSLGYLLALLVCAISETKYLYALQPTPWWLLSLSQGFHTKWTCLTHTFFSVGASFQCRNKMMMRVALFYPRSDISCAPSSSVSPPLLCFVPAHPSLCLLPSSCLCVYPVPGVTSDPWQALTESRRGFLCF